MIDWQPLILTFKLATITTLLLFIMAVPIGYWLAYSRFRFKTIIETLISMPLVLPPTVLGFYLLLAFSPSNSFGLWLDSTFGLKLAFSFEGLVIASIIYSMPFMIHPIQGGFKAIPPSLKESSYLLGKSRWQTIIHVLLPNMKPSILTGLVLAFAHTIGEFGVILMIGGSIPGKTKVASISIYEEVESLNYGLANSYSLILFGLTFMILFLVYSVNGGQLKRYWK